jgi:uncharacterized protein (DUF952 family)
VSRIYKILPRAEWETALAGGRFEGSAVDLEDGYIHFSTAGQAQETARRHFHGQAGLVVLEVEAEDLGQALRWEPSRGGDLFPHLYGGLEVARVRSVTDAPLGADGTPQVGPFRDRLSPQGGRGDVSDAD